MHERRFAESEHQPFSLPGERGGALLIHGFMGTPNEMRPLAHELNQFGFHTVVPLLPGFGPQVERLVEVGERDWVQAAADIWESLYNEGNGTILVGYSMGGSIAMKIAAQHPPEKLVLLAPLWRMMGGNWSITLLPLLKYVIRRAKPFQNVDFTDPKLRGFFEIVVPGIDLDDPTVQESIRNDASISTRTLDELRRVASAAGKFAGRIKVDTLVIQGSSDYTVRGGDTRVLVARIGENARLVEVNAGHLLLSTDSPSWPQVRDLVLDFVNGIPE